MSLHTLHHEPDRTELPPAADMTAAVAATYPADAACAQRLLAHAAVAALNASGRLAWSGRCGDHATAETAVPGGTLVLVPMAGLSDLDAVLADEDDLDPAVWHVLARDPHGSLLRDPSPRYGCPSVLWAVRAGIDPACAAALVQVALADPAVHRALRAGLPA